MKNNKKHFGFTLIELLVVVLIIGILAAVALPQYQKAVWKARTTQLITSVRALAGAQDRFYMATGTGATSFDDLDTDVTTDLPTDVTALANSVGWAGPEARGNGHYAVGLNNHSGAEWINSVAMFMEGPYMGNGFTIVTNATYYPEYEKGKLYCFGSEDFCVKLMKGKLLEASSGSDLVVYEM